MRKINEEINLGETREGKWEDSLALAPVFPPFFPRRFSRLRCNSLYHLNIAVYYLYSWNRLSSSSWLFKLPVVPERAAVSMSLFQSLFCLSVYLFIYLSLLAGGLTTCAIFLKLFRKRISCVSVLMICSLYSIFDKIFLVR